MKITVKEAEVEVERVEAELPKLSILERDFEALDRIIGSEPIELSLIIGQKLFMSSSYRKTFERLLSYMTDSDPKLLSSAEAVLSFQLYSPYTFLK